MSNKEKFSNRQIQLSEVNTDLFSTSIKVNRSVFRNLTFTQQQAIHSKISDLNIAVNDCLDSEHVVMMVRENAEQTNAETNTETNAETNTETNTETSDTNVNNKKTTGR